ncbi:MAG TPA: nitrogen regulation protein NR(I) [Massilia sp.]|nr:nitrogen regulation protein NR(I) [Massilia sp.]
MEASRTPRILVVDDDGAVQVSLALLLKQSGFDAACCDGPAPALALLAREPFDLVLQDMNFSLQTSGAEGLALLEAIRKQHPQLPVLLMTAWGSIALAVNGIKAGAANFFTKPWDNAQLVELVRATLDLAGAPAGGPTRAALDSGFDFSAIVGEHPKLLRVLATIGQVAKTRAPVLILGESGTGKELVANALHRESPRAQGPFVALNTAAIPSELLESELFGHEAGAFTGAQRRHIGRFEQADGGTLFLDEIGDMPLPLQTRLLRVLAQGEFFRVGGRELIRVDVRVVAATHQDLEGLVAQGKFRADLLHRLDVVRLQLPPLRERREDIAQLASTFLAAAARKLDTPPKRLTAAALQALREHDWPGNVRELENVCWRMAALAAADTIGVADVDTALNRTRGRRGSTSGADPGQWEALLAEWARRQLAEGVEGLHAQVRERVDHALLEAALQITHGRRAEAAARLGLGRNTLTRKLGAGRRRGGH